MYRHTPQERAEIVSLYIENNRSAVLTQRAYRRKYPHRTAPTSVTIRRLASNFFEHGSVADRQQHPKPRPRRSNELFGLVFAREPSLGHSFSNLVRQSMAIDIGGCWRTLCYRKCVKKVWKTSGSNKMARHATQQTQQWTICVGNSRDELCPKTVILTGRQDLQI